MSIADKLTYLNTTKQLLKTEINKINNVLDDNSTFRSYPQELFNGYLDILNNGTDTLWNNLEKVSQTGTEAVLEGVETAPMKMVLNGNTSQETTSGKNLLGLTNGTYSHNGITAVVNDGTITITGTATANSFVNIPLIKDIVLSNEQVTASINNATTISDTATEFRVYESGTNYIPVQFTTINRKSTTTKTGTFVSAYVRTTSGVSYGSGLVIKPQLEYGSTATSWEKYTGGQPSPSPDYPQQIKVVTGENVVSVSGKNLLNPSVARHHCNVNNDTGIITITTNATDVYIQGAYAYSEANKFLTLPSGNYYLKSTNPNVRITFYGDVASLNTTSQQPQELNSETNFGGIRIRSNSSLQNVSFGILLSTTDDTYVPYSKTDYPINLGDIELCKINTYKDFPFKAINGNEYYDTLTEEQKNALNYGKWYLHKETIKEYFKDMSWSFQSTPVGPVNRTVVKLVKYTINDNFYSDIFSENSERPNVFIANTANWYLSLADSLTGVEKTDYSSIKVSKVVAYLTTKNAYIIYPLATPTDTEITNSTLIEQLEAISKAKSVKDKTYITQTNDGLPFILDVEAIKEYEVN